MMQEISNIEKSEVQNQQPQTSAKTKKSKTRMDDLLREIKRLSTQIKDGNTDSEAVVSQSTSM